FLERAILFEARRQIDVLEDGGTIIQETRLYDDVNDETRSMRTKEDAHDYRYFPDPDLPPLIISNDWIEQVRADMPELPVVRRERYETELGLPAYDAAQLTVTRDVSDFFEATMARLPAEQAKLASNWIMGELAASLNREERDIADSPVTPDNLASLVQRIADGTLSNKAGREVFAAMWAGEHERNVDAIIEARGLKQVSDAGAITALIDEVLAAHPAIVEEYRAGKQKAFNSVVGQVMKAGKGKVSPAQVNQLLKEKLGCPLPDPLQSGYPTDHGSRCPLETAGETPAVSGHLTTYRNTQAAIPYLFR